MATTTIPFNLCRLYDRAFDGVECELTVKYDLEDLKKNRATDDNLRVIEVNFIEPSLSFLSRLPFDIPRIKVEVFAYFNEDISRLSELFVEEVEEDIYKELEEAWF